MGLRGLKGLRWMRGLLYIYCHMVRQNTMGIGYMLLWGFRAKSGVDGLDVWSGQTDNYQSTSGAKNTIRVCTIDIVYTVDKVDSVDNVNNMMWLKLIIWVGTLRIANLRIAYQLTILRLAILSIPFAGRCTHLRRVLATIEHPTLVPPLQLET